MISSSSFICQGTSTRKLRSELFFDHWVKLAYHLLQPV